MSFRSSTAIPKALRSAIITSTSRRGLMTFSASPSSTSVLRSMAPMAQRGLDVQKRSYHEKVIDHYENPRNVGTLDKNDEHVGTGLVGAPACGDVMKLQIKVDPNGVISDVKFKTFGCGSAIASSSYMTERVKGLTLEAAGAIKNTEIAKELCLPPVKLHCSMLAEDAIRSAIKDYQSKRLKASAATGKSVEMGATPQVAAHV